MRLLTSTGNVGAAKPTNCGAGRIPLTLMLVLMAACPGVGLAQTGGWLDAVRSFVTTQPVQPAEAGPATESAPSGGQARPAPAAVPGEGSDSVRVSNEGRVEMHVANLPLATVLQLLSVRGKRNIVATPTVSGTVTAHLYNVTFEEALDAILVSNQAGYREVGNFIYVHTNQELAELHSNETPPETRVFKLHYVRAADALAVVAAMLTEVGKAVASPLPDKGVASSATEGGGDALTQNDFLVVHDRPRALDRIAKVLRELDIRPRQVLLEATILGASLEDENALGVDFTVLGGVDLELMGSTSTAVTNLNVGELPQNRFEKFNSNVTTDFTGAVPNGGMTIGVIKDNVGVFVRALESVTDTIVLANPKVLALNKQKGQVIVGRRDGYLTTTVTETQAIQTVEFLETGTQLIFRPFIGDDGYVRMELHPEDSVGNVVNGLPSEQTTEVTTNVMVKDGHTILIGGLFREVTSDSRNQVPGLGSIPVVGTIFRARNDRTVRQEVIILLTVHIVKDDELYAQAGEEVRQDLERMRVGTRRHLMWTGRERLAQAHYQKSLEHFANGDNDKALWDVRMALHNNPRLLPAVELKEEILGRRDWDDEGAAAREFISRAIRGEPKGTIEPPYGRPAPPFVRPDPVEGPDGFDDGDSPNES